ncbi:hypothetical protein DL96DRAFT_1593016 [Flagelloscypha sp. PMI_526]|nr:hypothetical protein DL96DRAFT_1593016 [Flagelloscypha sp. PMI_526]
MPDDRQYARLPQQDELDAAFESDDEELDAQETTRLTRDEPPQPPRGGQQQTQAYDFERVVYDGPPPTYQAPGNSNGQIPSFEALARPPNRGSWFSRFIPDRFRSQRSGPMGGGTVNAVFGNITQKPTAQVTVTDGDSTYVVPEDARAEAPPSYASAQADSVPPYWETTVHAPFAADASGEMIVDSLPTGSLFSFLWNLLISVSFQFLDDEDVWVNPNWPPENDNPHPFPTAIEGNGDLMNGSFPSPTDPSPFLDDETTNKLIASATTEWLSFFLMTIGWFILLTSVLGFWRIKRWESSIIQSHRENGTGGATAQDNAILSRLELAFGLNSAGRAEFFRSGLGLRSPSTANSTGEPATRRADEGRGDDSDDEDDREHRETDFMLAVDTTDRTPAEREQIRVAVEHEQRLHNELRAAGLL